MPSRRYYAGLDLLRLAAAGLVVVSHFGVFTLNDPVATGADPALAFPFLHRMQLVGSIGVEIFFLISGFVISASALGSTAANFAVRRAIRILPALWVSGLIAAAASLMIGLRPAAVAAELARSALLSPVGPYIDGVIWTLVVEAVFYLLIFASILTGLIRDIERLALTLGAASMAFIATAVTANALAAESAGAASLADVLQRFPFKVLLLRHGVFFAAGMLLSSGYKHGFSPKRLAWIAALTVFCSLEICLDRPGVRTDAACLGLWWTSLGVLLLSVSRAEPMIAAIGPRAGLVRSGGLLSYTLYLNHYTVGQALVLVLARAGLSGTPAMVASLSVIVFVSYVVMIVPERVLQRRLRNAWRGRAALRRSASFAQAPPFG